MMRKLATPVLAAMAMALAAFCIVACGARLQAEPGSGSAIAAGPAEIASADETGNDKNEDEGAEIEMASGAAVSNSKASKVLAISVGSESFTVRLAEGPAAAALAEKAPLSASFAELNGNEKYAYLDISLPTDPHMPATIEAGDVMLYGDNCLVVFYESHPNTYSYTLIGTLDQDPMQFSKAVGARADTAIDLIS